MKHWEHHNSPVASCAGCKALTVGFGSVPGGTRAGSTKLLQERTFAADVDAYYRARKAGEKPDTSTRAGVRKARQRQESLERVRKLGVEIPGVT